MRTKSSGAPVVYKTNLSELYISSIIPNANLIVIVPRIVDWIDSQASKRASMMMSTAAASAASSIRAGPVEEQEEERAEKRRDKRD